MAATMTIRYERDPETGARRIIVDYQSESDALPMEHEEEHRALVEKLIAGGLIDASEGGAVVIERTRPRRNADDHLESREEPEREAQPQSTRSGRE